VQAVSITVTDIGAGIRAGNATRALMDNAAAAQQQRVIKNAKQQPAPPF
jgi:hypothetical protein